MAEQELVTMKFSFTHNVKEKDVDQLERLQKVLKQFGKLELKDNVSKPLNKIVKSLEKLNGLNIGVNLGKGVLGIIDTINSISEIKDISPHTANLSKSFAALGEAAKEFNVVSAKIPVNLGRGITGLINAINQITNIKDVSKYAEKLKNSFKILAEATIHFNGLENADYSGIAKLITAIGGINKVKAIDDTIVKNAEKLAEAINILDKNVTSNIPKMDTISQLAKTLGVSFNTSSKDVDRFGKSLKLLDTAIIIRAFNTITRTIKKFGDMAYSMVDSFGRVQNTLSFFGQSLDTESERIGGIIQKYAELGAIDFTEFANQTAILNQMYRGYGIAANTAADMALSMTQLAYDASYALGENGKDIQRWFDLITSFSVGQTKAGYRFGVDTTVKKLAEEFDGLSNSTDKMTKFLAAYNVLMEQTVKIQGQLPREFQNTYVQAQVFQNRLKQLKQSIGQALVPLYQEIIKWSLTALKVLEYVIDAVVKLFGGEGFKIINYSNLIKEISSGTSNLSDTTSGVADGLANANKQAKELKKTITGIDQVFTINDTAASDTGGLGALAGLATDVPSYTWLDALASSENLKAIEDANKSAGEIFEKIKNLAPYVAAVATGLAAWKISASLLNGLKTISGLKGVFGGLGLNKLSFFTGLVLLIDDLKRLADAIKDKDIGGIISSFVGIIGDVSLIAGNLSLAGIFKLIQGVVDVFNGLKGISEGELNWTNIEKILHGISSVVIGIGLINKDWQTVGAGIALQGIVKVVEQLKEIINAVETGDWSNVDAIDLVIGAVMTVGGLVLAFGGFNKIVGATKVATTATSMGQVSAATGGVSTGLVSLMKNLGIGLVVITELVAAALIFTWGIEQIGIQLEKIGIAFQPVLENGQDIAISIGLGTLLLVGVGTAAFALGTLGMPVVVSIGIGTAMLALLTGATVLFIQELKLVGEQLTYELHPVMKDLTAILPELTENTRNFTKYMIEFAGHLVAYTDTTVISGLAGTINTIVGWFTKDPIKKMTDDVTKNKKQFGDLNNILGTTNPLVREANRLIEIYLELLAILKINADKVSSIGTPKTIGTDFKDFSRALSDGFKDLENIKTKNISNIMSALGALDLTKFKGIGTSIVKAMELSINEYTYNFNTAINKLKNGLSFSGTSIGNSIASGVVSGINNWYPDVSTFTERLKKNMRVSFEIKSPSRWAREVIGENIASGVEQGVNETAMNLNPFRNNISKSLFDAVDDIDVIPTISLAGFDTKKINSSVSGVSAGLSAKVSGQFEYNNDGTEKAIREMSVETVNKLERLITAVEDGRIIQVDGDKIGEISDKYAKGKSVRLNTVFK